MIGKKTLESKPIPAAKVKEILEEFKAKADDDDFVPGWDEIESAFKEVYGDTWVNSYLFYEERFIMRTTGPKSSNDLSYHYTDLSKISLMKHSIFFRTAARQRVWINRFCLSVEEERQIMDIFKARCLNVKDRIFVLK